MQSESEVIQRISSNKDDREFSAVEENPLPEGFIEEKVQIDRRKLEAMITGFKF